MGEGEDGNENPHPPPPSRSGGSRDSAAVVGEIVEVQGGHILRSTGRKDRHSKVCTAKGPRDRRVRLAAHTAIQFYDVQDRLGYDRPSKAVDWLIKKAKAAIDELAELPAWHPTDADATSPPPNVELDPENAKKKLEQQNQPHNMVISNASRFSSKSAMAMLGGGNQQMPRFLPPSLDSDVFADTIMSFFPIGAVDASSSGVQFQSFPTNDLFSRNSSNNNQDLKLSLQSFQHPNFIHHHTSQPPPHTNPSPHNHPEPPARSHGQQNILKTGIPLGFDGWQPPPEPYQPSPELYHLHRRPSWSSGASVDSPTAGFSFGSLPNCGQNNPFIISTQRGPLQSSNTPPVRAWMDPPPAMSISMADHHHHRNQGALPVYPLSSFSGGIGFSGYGGFSGFHVSARIQGDEEEHDGYSGKPSSPSTDSFH